MYYLSQNGVRSGIGGIWEKGDANPARRTAQTPKCIRARPSPLLSTSLNPTEAEVFRKRELGHDFCPASRSRKRERDT
eukprot:174794-Pleurochrysis_carterae.AAC.2